MKYGEKDKNRFEYIRKQSQQIFSEVRESWIEAGRWALPHTVKYLLTKTNRGERINQHIVDPTHILSLRSCVAGFMEGNSSASRPWFRILSSAESEDVSQSTKRWLEIFTNRVRRALSLSNFYYASAGFYAQFNVYNTGSYWIDELPSQRLFFHLLIPGSYTVMNNALGEAVLMEREIEMTVKQLVEEYGTKVNGQWKWDNFSKGVRKMYENSEYDTKVKVAVLAMENPDFDPSKPIALLNRKWIIYSYETGDSGASGYDLDTLGHDSTFDPTHKDNRDKFLRVEARSRKPFVVGAGPRNGSFPYGETGPTFEALGLIKSLNYKAIVKDQALEQMVRPAVQGPANLNRSYITTNSNSFVPLDPMSAKPGGGLRTIFEINPGMGALLQDQADLRRIVDKFYYADFLLFLSNNPKTRTAAEANAIVQEQQTVIGPQLQSLNFTHNFPIVDYVMDYVLETDPMLPPPPAEIQGEFLKTDFISIFAQATRAADLPGVDRYLGMIMNVGQLDPSVLQKANLDKIADIYEDRLYLPVGVNNPQDMVDARREREQAMAQRNRMIEEQMPAMAGAARDVGLSVSQQQ